MNKFINDDFLLANDSAKKLYFEYAEPSPIVDFHSHLSAEEMASDKKWKDIYEIWLGGDHYKWRAMRSAGVPEDLITGEASGREKFFAFAGAMPKMIRNPLYHWCHLELARFFGIDDLLLSEKTAEEVWERANEKISCGLSARKCLEMGKVEVACTTDDPCDSLESHKSLSEDENFATKVCPTFRVDKAMSFGSGEKFAEYLEKLSGASGVEISSYTDFIEAIKRRHDFFDSVGCRSSDYGLASVPFAENFPIEHLDEAFVRAANGERISEEESEALASETLLECSRMDFESGWVRQFHIGPMRNNNSAMFAKLGPDSGFDSMGESNYARSLSRHLDTLNSEGKLARTIFYNIHPKDSEMLASMLGNFQDGSFAGKMQLGAAWWFLDQKDGIERHLEIVSAMSLLPCFVGMLTDSRSFLSFSRHEYFRRILCSVLGRDMEAGILPRDFDLVGEAVSDISYRNAKSYFGF